jgi:fermentation-respiration switch protein FrsA (DUF1100 family)
MYWSRSCDPSEARGLSPDAPTVTAALSLGALLLALFLGLRWYEQQSMYYPTHDIVRTPADAGLTFENVALTTADGETLHGWWVPSGRPDAPAVLFLHGNGGNVSHRLEKLAVFRDIGADTLIIDYRGYGRSSGTPSEQGFYRDARAAYDWLTTTRGVAPERIVAYGESLGSAVAVHLAAEVSVGGVVVESGFTSVKDIAQKRLPFLPVQWILKHRFDSLDQVHRIDAPLLILHSRQDELFEMSHPERLLAAAQPPKRLVEMQGGHNDAFLVSAATYRDALATFLTEARPAPTTRRTKETP